MARTSYRKREAKGSTEQETQSQTDEQEEGEKGEKWVNTEGEVKECTVKGKVGWS